MQVLRHAHRPGADDPVGTHIDLCRLFDLRAGQTGLVFDIGPVGRIHGGAVGVEIGAMLRQEDMVQNGRAAFRDGGVFGGEDGLRHAAHGGHVTAQMRLEVVAGDIGRAAAQHFDFVLRVGKPFQPAFADRVEDDDPRAAQGRLTQVAQHARMVRAGVLTDHENGVRFLEIVQAHGALADADGLPQGDTAGFVAHIRTIREIVRAVEAHE